MRRKGQGVPWVWLGLMSGAKTSGLLPDHLSWVRGGRLHPQGPEGCQT